MTNLINLIKVIKVMVILGDATDVMKRFADNQFDLAIVDPPYFEGPNNRGYYGNRGGSRTGVRRKDYQQMNHWALPDDKYFEELFRVSRSQIVWGGNYFSQLGEVHKTPRLADLAEWKALHPTGWIIWDKCNGNSSFNDVELAWTSLDRPTVTFRYMWNGMMQGKDIVNGHIQQGDKRKNEKRIHVTQKPVNLYLWQLREYAEGDWTILDTHLGSGSSRIAAYEMGVDFVGIEIDEQMFEKQDKRFIQYASALRLFN